MSQSSYRWLLKRVSYLFIYMHSEVGHEVKQVGLEIWFDWICSASVWHTPLSPAPPHFLIYVKTHLPSSWNYAWACVICNLANLSSQRILSVVFLRIWLVVGHCEGDGDPHSLFSLLECRQNKQHNISSDTSIFLGCHRWVSVAGGNNWVFTRRHFQSVLKYQPSLAIMGWMEFLSYVR